MFENILQSLQSWTWAIDGWIILAGALCAIACSTVGTFLVLRKMSLMGDAMSHAVLPGIVVAFLFTESRSSLPMFLGAMLVGVLTAFFIEWIQTLGRVDKDASMGVVFTSLFALGLVLIVQNADHVDLDPGCVLYGAIELTPLDTVHVWGKEIPRVILTLGSVCLLNLSCILVFYKEFKITSFDPALANTLGIASRWMHYFLMSLVAITTVAAFESVGNILVIAMLIVPPASAYLLTDRLGIMLFLSIILGLFSAALGHFGASVIPASLGYQTTTTAGMIALSTGVLFFLAVVFSPRYGILAKILQRLRGKKKRAQKAKT